MSLSGLQSVSQSVRPLPPPSIMSSAPVDFERVNAHSSKEAIKQVLHKCLTRGIPLDPMPVRHSRCEQSPRVICTGQAAYLLQHDYLCFSLPLALWTLPFRTLPCARRVCP